MTPASSRPTWIEVEAGAITDNVTALVAAASPAGFCAVVKAGGYGHGATQAARAALRGGATWLAVAVADEGAELRADGIEAPILVLSDSTAEGLDLAARNKLTVTVSSREAVAAVARAAVPLTVHLKVDTGMHRMGAAPGEAVGLARAAREAGVYVGGVFTHLAVADEPRLEEVTRRQLRDFAEVVVALEAAGLRPPLVHAANSAGTLGHPDARLDLVRCGIAIYGYPPVAAPSLDLRPALSLKSTVVAVREIPAGDGVSYGWVLRPDQGTRVATVAVGYADGVPRSLGEARAEVLIGGRRFPMIGRVTMDQLMVEVDESVAVGAPVVLLGRQGNEQITADEWAAHAGTISYEVLTSLGPRLPRRYV